MSIQNQPISVEKLVVAVSPGALFNLDESHAIKRVRRKFNSWGATLAVLFGYSRPAIIAIDLI